MAYPAIRLIRLTYPGLSRLRMLILPLILGKWRLLDWADWQATRPTKERNEVRNVRMSMDRLEKLENTNSTDFVIRVSLVH